MGQLTIVLGDNVEEKLREYVKKTRGNKRGLSLVIEKAVEVYLKREGEWPLINYDNEEIARKNALRIVGSGKR